MILKREAPLLSAAGLKQTIGTALAYGLLIALANASLMTNAGFELRPGAFVPIVAGLLFGLPAAIGSFLGNFFSLLLTGYDFMPAIFASALNFLLAYTPYRFWYGYQSHKATLYVYNNRTFLKFVLSNLLGGSSLAIIWSFFMQGAGSVANFTLVFVTFINNFAFPMLIGLPILLLWDKYAETEYYRPAEKAGWWQAYSHYALPALIITELLGLQQLLSGHMSQPAGLFFAVLGLLLWFCALQLPSDYETHPEELAGFQSLVSSVTVRLFVGVDALIIAFLILWIGLSDGDLSFWRTQESWMELCRIIATCLVMLITGSYLVLLVMERSLTQRLKMLCARVNSYIATRDLTQLQNAETNSDRKNELDILENSLNKMGRDITSYLADLDKTIAEQEAINTQLKVAASIQNGTLPKLDQVQPRLTGYKIAGGMKPARSIGGDSYDAFLLDDDHLIISIADVAGKGIPAALFMMITQSLLRENTKTLPLTKAIEQTNNILVAHNEQCLFVTVWLAQLELSTGRISYINAGHNPALLAPAEAGEAIWLNELSGPVLGLMPDLTYSIHEAELPVGGRLLLYTDGLNEAENSAHDFFGNQRLEQSFLKAREPEEILSAIHSFVLDAEQSDDMTYLWLERKEVPHAAEE